MMLNIFRKNPVVLNCYTARPYVYNKAPILVGKQATPTWFTQLPTQYNQPDRLAPFPTMRTCAGVVEQFQHGVFIPMWSELIMQIGAIGTNEWRYEYADAQSSATVHPVEQRGTYLPDDQYQHLKLNSPWLFTCDEDVKWQYLGAPYNFDAPEEILFAPGIVDYKYQHVTNVNMLFKRKEKSYTVTLRHGQPMVQIVPLTERPLVVKQHLLSNEEFARLQNATTPLTFIGKYARIKKRGKCPFGGN